MFQNKFWKLLFAFISISFFARAQKDTSLFYIKKDGRYVSAKDSADIIRTIYKSADDEKLYVVHDRYANGENKMIAQASNKDGSKLQGLCMEFFENGKKKSDEFYKDDVLLGPVTAYYPNGKFYMSGNFADKIMLVNQYRDSVGNVLATDGNGEALEYDDAFTEITARGNIQASLKQGKWLYFNHNKLWYALTFDKGLARSGVGYDSIGKEHPFYNIEEPAYFNDRSEDIASFIKRKTKYPVDAKKANIRGSVHISFIIEKNGALSHVKVIDGLGYGTEEEAIRVLSLTANSWMPAIQYGLPVRREYNLPVNFGLATTFSSFKPL